MSMYELGDMVWVMSRQCSQHKFVLGSIGIVYGYRDGYYAVAGSEEALPSGGHSCDGLVPSGNGDWVAESDLLPVTVA
jgi:hypothetical protein